MSTTSVGQTAGTKPVENVDGVIIRFAGDSGDGMQLTGTRFTETSAIAGNDVATFPDFPAEIRAPAGTIAGVSGFQLQFAAHAVFTPGDAPDVLVAMNPAALKRNVPDLQPGAMILANEDAFTKKNLVRAGYDGNPLEDGSLSEFVLHTVPITKLTIDALAEVEGLTRSEKERCKNVFALGLCFWMYSRSMEPTLRWIHEKFGSKPAIEEANTVALKKGYDFGITTEKFASSYDVKAAPIKHGTYRNITGNAATALGFVAAAELSERDLVLGSYPITPASDVLHELSRMKNFRVRTVQAEDEIAAVCVALGASYGGSIGLTTSSGPGIALKGEAIALATSVELPLVVLNVQRAGPSTGMPTKTEQADLLFSLYGRHCESPLIVLAAATPGDCFYMAIEAVRLAQRHMTPVILLTDGYLANGAEPWEIPDVSKLPRIAVQNAEPSDDFLPFSRDPQTLARPWAVPGTPQLEHRIGGLEKANLTGHISYDPENHELMTKLRAEKIAKAAETIPPLEVTGDTDADVLVLGWGSTYGPIRSAVEAANAAGIQVAQAHLRYINPMPSNTEEVLRSYKRILIPEMNSGQLATVLRSHFLIDAQQYNKVQGQPFKTRELLDRIKALVEAA